MTPSNVAFLLILSALSGLVVTLNVFCLRSRLGSCPRTARCGYLSLLPALLVSACPGCAPLLLSFTGATLGVGLALARFGLLFKLGASIILLLSVLYLSAKISAAHTG